MLFQAYGPEAFGPGKEFVSAQASVVATMVSGVPNMAAFIVGAVAGFVLYLVRFPAMMLGLGMYLPFYMSLTAFLGVVVKAVVDLIHRKRMDRLAPEERAYGDTGLILASGLLGGESIMGIILAMIVSASALIG